MWYNVYSKGVDTMTVAELKKILENLEDDMEVMVDDYDYEGFNHADTEIIYPRNDKPFLRVY